jgi:membrane protein DedA with SNARE-associated domain
LNNQKWELLPFWFPKSKRDQIWAIVFISLTILSIDWWNWDSGQRFGEWIPTWIVYLVLIQFALAYSVWKFSREWQKNE